MPPLHTIPARLVVTCVIGYMAPMVAMWFLAPTIQASVARHGLSPGNTRTVEWWLGFIPYPVPFTARAALGLAIVIVPPLVFVLLWRRARRRARTFSLTAGTG